MNCFAQKWQNLGLLASSHGAFVVFLRCLFVRRFVQCFFVTDFLLVFLDCFFDYPLNFFFSKFCVDPTVLGYFSVIVRT